MDAADLSPLYQNVVTIYQQYQRRLYQLHNCCDTLVTKLSTTQKGKTYRLRVPEKYYRTTRGYITRCNSVHQIRYAHYVCMRKILLSTHLHLRSKMVADTTRYDYL